MLCGCPENGRDLSEQKRPCSRSVADRCSPTRHQSHCVTYLWPVDVSFLTRLPCRERIDFSTYFMCARSWWSRTFERVARIRFQTRRRAWGLFWTFLRRRKTLRRPTRFKRPDFWRVCPVLERIGSKSEFPWDSLHAVCRFSKSTVRAQQTRFYLSRSYL